MQHGLARDLPPIAKALMSTLARPADKKKRRNNPHAIPDTGIIRSRHLIRDASLSQANPLLVPTAGECATAASLNL